MFYCHSKNLYKFLKLRGHTEQCSFKNIKETNKFIWGYAKSPELHESLMIWKNNKPNKQ